MSESSGLGGSPRIGVALRGDRIWAIDTSAVGTAAGRGDWWSRPLEPLGESRTAWPELEAVLAELRKAKGGRGTLSIALLPPLAQVRILDLPPLDTESASRLVARNAARYFIGVTEPQIVNLTGGGESRGETAAVAAAAAPTRVIEAVYRAATGAGWTVRVIAPSYESWIAGVARLWPAMARRHSQIVILGENYSDVLVARDGSLSRMRQFRDAGADADRIAAALVEHPERLNGAARQPIAALGSSRAKDMLAERLQGSGLSLAVPDAKWNAVADSPEHMAAAFAPLAGNLALLPEEALDRQRTQGQKLAQWCLIGAVVLAALSAGLMLWDAKRELASVRAERATISDGVRKVAQARDTIARLTRRVTTLRQIQDAAPQWSAVIGQLATHLPPDAYLATLRTQGDSITLTGLAQAAAPAIEELQRTPGLTHVTQFGQIRREAVLGGQTAEQFSVRAWIPSSTVAVATPRSATTSGGTAP